MRVSDQIELLLYHAARHHLGKIDCLYLTSEAHTALRHEMAPYAVVKTGFTYTPTTYKDIPLYTLPLENGLDTDVLAVCAHSRLYINFLGLEKQIVVEIPL